MRIAVVFFSLVLVFWSCKSRETQNTIIDSDFESNESYQQLILPDTNFMGMPIFSNMNLNMKLSEFFSKSGGHYKSELLHSIKMEDTYLSSQARSINLGVYSVDFNYTRIYRQLQESEHYLNTILSLGSKLGIPNDFIEVSAERLEQSIAHADSFANIANEIYVQTKNYFTENENEYNVLLILVGGLSETFYIASNLPITPTGEIFTYDILYNQKSSLESLIQNCLLIENNDIINEVLVFLNEINETLQSVEGYTEEEKINAFQTTKTAIEKLRTHLIEIP